MTLIDEITSYWNNRAEGYSQDVAQELQDDRQGTLALLDYLLTQQGLLSLPPESESLSIIGSMGSNGSKGSMDAATPPNLPLTGYRALDLGCGPALLSIHLAKLGCTVTAIDNSTSMLQHAQELSAQQLSPEALTRITFQQGNAMEPEVTTNSYDLVVSRDMFWILSDPLKAYSHALQALKSNGLMVIFDGNYYYGYADSAYQKDYSRNHQHLHNVDVNVIARLAQDLPLSYQLRPRYDFTLLQQVVKQEQLSLHFTAYLHHDPSPADANTANTANTAALAATTATTSTGAAAAAAPAETTSSAITDLATGSWTMLYDSPVHQDVQLANTAAEESPAQGELIEKFVIAVRKEQAAL